MAPKMQRSDPTATNEAYEAYKEKGAFEKWRERKGIIHGIKYDLDIPEEREKFEKAKEMMDKEELDAVRNGTGASEDQQNKAALREKIDHWFDLYDKDNNGFLSLREFQAILVGCGMDRTKAKALFDAADTMNKDGYLGGKKVGKSDGAVSKNEFFRWIFSGTAEQSGEREIGHAVSEHAQREITPDAALSQLAQVLSEKMHDEAFVEKMEAILVKKGIVAEGGNALTCKDLFNVFDVNKNGTVSTSEFVSGLATIGWKMDNKLAGALFSLIDLEDVKTRFVDAKGNAIYQRSGFLDEKEFMNALMR